MRKPLLITLICLAAIHVAQLSAQTRSGASADNPPPYRFIAGDVVEFDFFYNSELNQSMQIRPDGRVSLPLIGEFAIQGKTVSDARAELQQLYSPILKTPSLNLTVKSFAGQKVFVGGEVNRPATLDLSGGLTAPAAIFEAGGPRKTGALGRVLLIHKSADGTPERRVLDLSLDNMGRPLQADAFLQLAAYDVLIVPERKVSKFDRWVDEYLRQAVPGVLTGGFTYLFNPLTTTTVP
jgi:polysaccharide biosynthesis/export protein